MRYLLDTHALLWSLFSPDSLSAKARGIITDPDNEIYVSVISFWEISLKYNLGKLELVNYTPEDLPPLADRSGFTILDLSSGDASSFYRLTRNLHRDPFDRMLIWQAVRNDLVLISRDEQLGHYEQTGLKMIW